MLGLFFWPKLFLLMFEKWRERVRAAEFICKCETEIQRLEEVLCSLFFDALLWKVFVFF